MQCGATVRLKPLSLGHGDLCLYESAISRELRMYARGYSALPNKEPAGRANPFPLRFLIRQAFYLRKKNKCERIRTCSC